MNPITLKEVLQDWQRRLNLSDWEVEVQVVYSLHDHWAELEVVDPEGKYALLEISRNCPEQEVESTLVHELLELVFESAHNIIYLHLPEEEVRRWLNEEEKAVEHLTACLLSLKRCKRGMLEGMASTSLKRGDYRRSE